MKQHIQFSTFSVQAQNVSFKHLNQQVISMNKYLKIILFLCISTTFGQSDIIYNSKFSQNENGVFYTDTTIWVHHISVPNKEILHLLQEKYVTKELPILKTDSTTYIISYSHFHKKSTLWFTVKFEHDIDSINIKIFNIQYQHSSDHNFPSPHKMPIEKIYNKYLKCTNSKKQRMYERLFIDMENNIDETRKHLIQIIQKK